MFSFFSKTRNYDFCNSSSSPSPSFHFENTQTNDVCSFYDLNPYENKLFSEDTFSHHLNKIKLVHSPTRTSTYLAGVLILKHNKTFGKNKNKMLYKCIPNNPQLPIFLVPYDISLGFSKNISNKYVIFQFTHWNEKHPHGVIIETIGDVHLLSAFFEYQLYVKHLHVSLKHMTKQTLVSLKSNDEMKWIDQIKNNPHFHIIDKTKEKEFIFSIDAPTTIDFDDAFSVQRTKEGKWRVSIYIANVFVWLETLHLWGSCSGRVSTIYLPETKKTMLPTILADHLCSLKKNNERFVFALDLFYTSQGIHIEQDTVFYNALINVEENFFYDDPLLSQNSHYLEFLDLSKKIDKQNAMMNEHSLVSFWMMEFNKQCAKNLAKHSNGIFRTTTPKCSVETLLSSFYNWNNVSGQYTFFSEDVSKLYHCNFCGDKQEPTLYVHITSPIRRLVDLLNSIILFKENNMIDHISAGALTFVEKWTQNLNHINSSMKNVKKLQMNCHLVHHCFSNSFVMKETYEGVVFEKILKKNDHFSYMVLIEKLKLLSTFTTNIDLPELSRHTFQLFLFEEENDLKKKIKVVMLL